MRVWSGGGSEVGLGSAAARFPLGLLALLPLYLHGRRRRFLLFVAASVGVLLLFLDHPLGVAFEGQDHLVVVVGQEREVAVVPELFEEDLLGL